MKSAFVFAMVMLAIAMAASAATSAVTVNMISQTPDPVEPGDSAELRFRLENNGSSIANDIEAEILTGYPLSIQGETIKGLGSIDVSRSGSNAVFVEYKIVVDPAADEGSYPVYVRYRTDEGTWVRVGPFYVDVQSAEAILSVVSAAPKTSFVSGKTSEYTVKLQNFGKSMLRDIRIRLDIDGISFSPVGGSNEKVLGNLAPGAILDAKFLLAPDASTDSGNYKAQVIMNYVDDSGNKHVRNSTVGLPVYNQPSIDVSIKESSVYTADSTGDVVLSISNTGPSEVRFMIIKLLETPDYQVISAPDVYIGNLEADDFETAEFKIRTARDVKNIPLKASIAYRDNLNSLISSDESLTLRIYPAAEARKLGLVTTQQNFLFMYMGLGVQLIILVFLLFMLIDCWKNTMPTYKKVLWTVLILTGIGAVLYYFIARRKK